MMTELLKQEFGAKTFDELLQLLRENPDLTGDLLRNQAFMQRFIRALDEAKDIGSGGEKDMNDTEATQKEALWKSIQRQAREAFPNETTREKAITKFVSETPRGRELYGFWRDADNRDPLSKTAAKTQAKLNTARALAKAGVADYAALVTTVAKSLDPGDFNHGLDMTRRNFPRLWSSYEEEAAARARGERV